MSFYVVDAVLKWDRYKNPTKAVLLALCSCINEERYQASGDTEVWPGTKRLMLLTGCSRDTIRRCIERLEQDGVITILSEGVGTETTHYIIHIAHIPQSCFIRSYMERTHTSGPDEGADAPTWAEGTRQYGGSMVEGTRKENNSNKSNCVTGHSPELPAINLGESRLIKGNGGGSGERTQQVAQGVHVPAESYRRGSGARPGEVAESYPNKEQEQRTNIERKSKLQQVNSASPRVSQPSSDHVSLVGPPEAELTPAEQDLQDEMFEFARNHEFWKKFTRPPFSRFRNGCLESESFRNQFKKFRKATTKVPPRPPLDFSDVEL